MPATTLHRNLLEPHPANRKHFDAARMAELHADIAARGVLDDLIVRPLPGRDGSDGQPTHQILSGERRWRAAEGTPAGDALPCKVIECDDLQALELVIVPNLQREDLHPLDEAALFDQMLAEPPAWARPGPPRGAGYTIEQLADRVHKRPAYVRARLRLLGLTPAARHAFLEDACGIGSALQIARLNSQHQEELVQSLLHDAAKGAPWSAETVSHIVQSRYMLRLAGAPFDLHDPALLPGAGACDTCHKRSGTNPELFDDITEGDTCTDRGCYLAKAGANTEQRITSAHMAGHTVITGAEAERLLPDPAGTVKGYLRLDRPSEFALSKKPLAEIIEPRDVVLIVRSTDTFGAPATVEVMPTAIVRQALKAKGLLREDAPPAADAGTTKPPREAKAAKPAAQPTAPTQGPRTAAAAPVIDDEVLAALLKDRDVFYEHELKRRGAAPAAALSPDLQRRRVAASTKAVRQLMIAARIGQALTQDNATGFPSEGLTHRVACTAWFMATGREIGDAAALARIAGGTLKRAEQIWKLGEDEAERLAIVLLAMGEELEGVPNAATEVAQALGIPIADIDQRAKDWVQERARIQLLKATPAAKPAAKAKPEQPKPEQAKPKQAKKIMPKYRCPATGSTWSGRGLMPKWLKVAIEGGAKLADFVIGAEGAGDSLQT